MIKNEKTLSGKLVITLKKGSHEKVLVHCDMCNIELGWLTYSGIAVRKDGHYCRSCARRKILGFDFPVLRIEKGIKYRHCTHCNSFKEDVSINFFNSESNKHICKECRIQQNKKWININKEYFIERCRRNNSREHNKKARKEYEKTAEGKAAKKKYKQSEKGKSGNIKYKQSPLGKAAAHRDAARRRIALSKATPMTADMELILREEIRQLHGGEYRCLICGKLMKEGGREPNSESWEHFIPLKLIEDGTYDIDANDMNNMTYICYSCNSVKNAVTMKQYIEENEIPFKSKEFILKKLSNLKGSKSEPILVFKK
jgi:hypothetical protein